MTENPDRIEPARTEEVPEAIADVTAELPAGALEILFPRLYPEA